MTATATFEDLRAEDLRNYEDSLRDTCLRDIMKWRTNEWRDMAIMCEEALEAQVEAGKPIQPHVWAQARVYRDMAVKSRHIRYGEEPRDTERKQSGNGSGNSNGTGGGRDKGMATEKQLSFLASLLAGRTDEVAQAAQARIDSVGGHVNRETASKLIDQLTKAVDGMVAYKERMTQGQAAFIAALIEEKQGVRADFARDMAYAMIPATTRNEASAIIDGLKTKPLVAPQVQIGFYEYGEDIVKVKPGRGGGRMYALIMTAPEFEGDKWSWTYVPGLMSKLVGATPLSMERAAEFGQLTGTCCICCAELTNEESIELGIGPVCRAKMGW